jgi:AcrR family transcriptional regulator
MARPQKPVISKDRAARAALDVLDLHGLEGFSLNLVAERLGVKAPSLYYHFKSRDELLAEAARLLLLRSPIPELKPDVDWREAVVAVSLASWRSVQAHPRAAPLLLQFFPRHLLIDAYEHWVSLFALKGVPTEWHLWILEGTEKLCFGSALFAAASRSRGLPPFPSYDPQQHPNLTAAIRANHEDQEGLFVEALRCFLRGVPDSSGAKDAKRAKARA